MDTCCPEDKTTPDNETVWQWRILHAKKYSRRPEPFPLSNEIGLDFNVGSITHRRLKVPFVQNGVILEVCDFARTVEESRMHFIPNILENNFDLGFENDQQRMDFSARIQHKLEDLIKKLPHCEHGVLPLFDTSPETNFMDNDVNMTSTEHQPADGVTQQENVFECSTEKAKEEVESSQTDVSHQKDEVEFSLPDITDVREDLPLLSSFPCCEKIGLSFSTQSKQTLDPGLLTTSVILELADFSHVLTGSFISIVVSVLEHNFELPSQEGKKQVLSLISDLLKKQKQFTTSSVISNSEFQHEPFFFQRSCLKRANVPALSSLEALLSKASKRQRLEFQSLQCETVPSETECVISGYRKREPVTKTLCDPADLFCDDEKRFHRLEKDPDPGSSENGGDPKNLSSFESDVPGKSVVDQEEIRLDTNLWKLRSNRVKEISSPLNERTRGEHHLHFVEFDLGFEPKRHLSTDKLTHDVLLRIAQFALTMTSSQQEFIMHILENNFDLGLHSESHRKTFASEVMKGVRELEKCEDAVKLTKEVFDLPFDMIHQSCGASSEPTTKSNTKDPTIVPLCASDAHSDAGIGSPSESVSWSSVDLYPFCKDIGLRLSVDPFQPNTKLAINKLTKGAMAEIASYAETLCGTFQQICMDVLRHNFDLQSNDSHLTTTILAQISAAADVQNFSLCFSNKSIQFSFTDPSILMNARKPSDTRAQHDPKFLLWMLRANHVEHILSVPHGEQCPLYPYSRCKKLGIDFDVGCGLEHNLPLRFLTNGVMVELNTFASALSSSVKDFMTEILEYNFDLNLKGELHRSAFVKQFLSYSVESSFEEQKFPPDSAFELPDLSCLEEDTPFCPKCYQDRDEILQEKAESRCMSGCPPNATTVKASADADDIERKSPMSTFPSVKMITASFGSCQESGLSLCVDRHQPKQKMGMDTVTLTVLYEVYCFAKKLCGEKKAVVNDILEHNFDLTQCQCKDIAEEFRQKMNSNVTELSWFDQVFDLETVPSGKNIARDCSQMMTDCDVPEESQPWLGTNHLTTSDCSSSPASSTEYSPELEIDTKLWKLRSKRVNEIIPLFKKGLNSFWYWRRSFLEFDIGFEPEQEYIAKRLTSDILFRVTCFALAMSSSHLEFIWETLENNFNFDRHNKKTKKRLAFQVMKTVKELRNCEDKVKLSQEMLELPDFLSDKNKFQRDVGAQTTPEAGLNLSVNSCRPEKRLPINKLTKGAMIDVVNFAEKLCGSFEEIFIDVLRHNFDLDLQSADCDLARNILSQIPLAVERKQVDQTFKQLQKRSSDIIIDCNRAYTEACSPGPIVAIQNQKTSEDSNIEAQNDPELLLWKLRASQIQQIPTLDHKEHCPFSPYTRCKKLGIDFNVGSGQKRNLDLKLLTNGVMVELFSFANSLWSSEEHFLTEIMEYNFHLKFKSPQHRHGFANMLKRQIAVAKFKKFTVPFLERLFELPDVKRIGEYTPFCPKCSYEPDYILPNDPKIDVQSTDDDCTEQNPAILPIATFPATKMLTELYHVCRKAGLTLCVDKNYPRVKMDKCKLTYEVIFDAYRFCKKLSGTKNQILPDLIQHNFNLDGQRFVKCPWFVFTAEMKSYNGEATWFDTAFDLELVFKEKLKLNEQPSERKSKMPKMSRRLGRRKMKQSKQFEEETEFFPQQSDVCTNPSPESSSYLCPVEEESHPERYSKRLRQMQGEEEEGHVDINAPSECELVQEERQMQGEEEEAHVDISAPSECELVQEERQMQGEEEEAHVDINAPSECDVVQEETLTETNLWKWRASRVKQIISDLNQETLVFNLKSVNLDFNVLSQPKQKLRAERLASRYLFKTALFALSLNASQQEFIMEILKKNFDLGLQNDYHEKFFARELMSTVRQLINSEPSVKYSNMMFDLSEFPFKMLQSQSSDIVKTEPSDEPVTRESVSNVTELDSLPTTPQNLKDLYPFCEAIGLKLNTKSPQPIEQLDICRLTNGAMTEVVNFAERLCGTFEQICMDVLRHNFDLDLQSTDSDLARSIFARIPLAVHHKTCQISRNRGSVKKSVSFNSFYMNNAGSPGLDEANENPSVSELIGAEIQNDPDLILWKLRANQIKQILTVPHTEQCPLYFYTRCKKLGIDFNVGSGLKRSLDPQLLTNGIMVELSTFADALLSSSPDFITEILEYNFDLKELNDELFRGAFASYIRYYVAVRKGFKRCTGKMFVWPELKDLEDKPPHCLKCYKIRNGIFPLDGAAPATTDSAFVDASCKTQKKKKVRISSFSAAEMLTESYRSCKKVGLKPIVDRDHPTKKLKPSVLTVQMLKEIDCFTKKLTGTKYRVVFEILQHNFSSYMLTLLKSGLGQSSLTFHINNDEDPNWFNETAKFLPGKIKEPLQPRLDALQKLQQWEALKKRQLQRQEENKQKTLQSGKSLSEKPTAAQNLYRFCSEIRLDSGVFSNSTEMSNDIRTDSFVAGEPEEPFWNTLTKGHHSAEGQSNEMDGIQHGAQHGAQLPQHVDDGYRMMDFCPNQAVQSEPTCHSVVNTGQDIESILMEEDGEEYEFEFEYVDDEQNWYQ